MDQAKKGADEKGKESMGMQHSFLFVHRYLQQHFMPNLPRTKATIIHVASDNNH
jgi:hypothetical protein